MNGDGDTRNLGRKAAKGLLWSGIEVWGSQISSFVVLLILARLLSPKDFGLVAASRVFIELAQIFVRQGLSDAIVQRHELTKSHLDTAFWINIVMGSAMAGVGICGSGVIAQFLGAPQAGSIIAVASSVFFINSLVIVQEGLLRRDLKFKSLALRRLGSSLVGGTTGIVLAFSGAGVWSLVFQQLSGALAACILLWWQGGWKPGLAVSKKAFQELFGFSSHILGSNLLTFASKRMDDFLIVRVLGTVALGYYTVAYKVLLVVIFCLTTVSNRVAFPAFSRLKGEPERMRKAFYRVTRMTSLISFPAFALIAVLAPTLVPVVFGKQWIDSIPVMQVLSLIGIVQSVSFFNGSVLRALGRPGWNLMLLLVGTVLNVLGFVLVVRWGIVAVATVFVINGYLMFPVGVWLVKKALGISWTAYFKQYVSSVLASLGMVAVILGSAPVLANNPLLALALQLCLGGIVYCGLIWMLDRAGVRELMDVARQTGALDKLPFLRRVKPV